MDMILELKSNNLYLFIAVVRLLNPKFNRWHTEFKFSISVFVLLVPPFSVPPTSFFSHLFLALFWINQVFFFIILILPIMTSITFIWVRILSNCGLRICLRETGKDEILDLAASYYSFFY